MIFRRVEGAHGGDKTFYVGALCLECPRARGSAGLAIPGVVLPWAILGASERRFWPMLEGMSSSPLVK